MTRSTPFLFLVGEMGGSSFDPDQPTILRDVAFGRHKWVLSLGGSCLGGRIVTRRTHLSGRPNDVIDGGCSSVAHAPS